MLLQVDLGVHVSLIHTEKDTCTEKAGAWVCPSGYNRLALMCMGDTGSEAMMPSGIR